MFEQAIGVTLASSLDTWEAMWSPYDEPTYAAVLEQIKPDDIVLEIGAGDLRLARRIAEKAQKVYAIERNANLLDAFDQDLPVNCHIDRADARWIPFPQDTTLAVLLMRHCSNFAQYMSKLTQTSCERLVTNARWRVGVETIDLAVKRFSFHSVQLGWYACICGGTGFLPGQAEQVTEQVLNAVWEVDGCPACQSGQPYVALL